MRRTTPLLLLLLMMGALWVAAPAVPPAWDDATPLQVARALAAHDATLAGRLERSRGPWRSEGGELVSAATGAGRATLDLRLPAVASGTLALRSGGRTMSLQPVDAVGAPARVEGAIVSYPHLWPSTDALWGGEPERVEVLLVLRDAAAPASFAWSVTSTPGPLRAVGDGDGGLVLGAGASSLRVRRPYAVDARGRRRDAKVSYEEGTLRLALDRDGLEYPILIDPAIEPALWQDLTPPGTRTQAPLAYDPVRRKIVLFGGQDPDGAVLSDTNEYDVATRRWATITTSGPGRYGHALFYDPARGTTVLFGGNDGSQVFGDMWEWNGREWSQVEPAGAVPAPRSAAGAAYDGAGTIVFGGEDGNNSCHGDTWRWDGERWTKLRPSTPPPARCSPAMASAPDGTVLLFGGETSSNVPLGDTWLWDGAQWAEQSPALAPSARYGAVAASTASEVLLTGGGESLFGTDTWAWQAGAWTQVSAVGDGRPTGAGAAFDGSAVVLFGGDYGLFDLPADTYRWSGTEWSVVTRRPTPCSSAAASFDSARGELVVFGGQYKDRRFAGPSFLGDTWTWDGAARLWKLASELGPGARAAAAQAFQTSTHQTLLFGGFEVATKLPRYFADTWSWEGRHWTERRGGAPPARAYAAMAEDPSTRLILFGGEGLRHTFDDTWAWDGSAWAKLSPRQHPPARFTHAMAYDRRRKATVLFGGKDAAGYFGDLWEWDGTSWSLRQASTSMGAPQPRAGGVLVYDDARGVSVLTGGEASTGTLNDTWEWDGSTWIQSQSGGASVAYAAGAFDTAHGQTLVFGGGPEFLVAAYASDLWAYQVHGNTCSCPGGGDCPSTDCDTGYCVDGVCCQAASLATTSPPGCGICSSCAAAGACAPVVDGLDPDSCPAGRYCDARGDCTAQRAAGTACTGEAECGSCLDCVAGACQPVLSRQDPQSCTGASTCGPTGVCGLVQGQTCADGAACASGSCVDGVCCDTACDQGCDVCAVSLGAQVNGACYVAPAGSPGRPACGATVCDGVAGQCPAGCSTDTGCAAGYYCDARQQCAPQVAAGDACDPSTECAGGQACRLCAAGSCVAGSCCVECSVSGACTPDRREAITPAGQNVACAPYACSEGQCGRACANVRDCLEPNVCDPGGHCIIPPEPDVLYGGCDVAPGGKPEDSPWALALFVVAGLALAARARRVSEALSPGP